MRERDWLDWVVIVLLAANLFATVGAAWSRQVVSVSALTGAHDDTVARLSIQLAILQAQLQQAQRDLETAKAAVKKP